jgi:cold shock CspA family protein
MTLNSFDTQGQEYPDDHFIHGTILKYFPQANYGFIRDVKGREIYFHLDEARLAGGFHRRDIKEGLKVGFDMSRTSRGLRATKIKVY